MNKSTFAIIACIKHVDTTLKWQAPSFVAKIAHLFFHISYSLNHALILNFLIHSSAASVSETRFALVESA